MKLVSKSVKTVMVARSVEVRVRIEEGNRVNIEYPAQNQIEDLTNEVFERHMRKHEKTFVDAQQVEHLFSFVDMHPETKKPGMYFMVETHYKISGGN